MNGKFGQFRIQSGEVPAGSDNAIAWRIFTAGEHPVLITACSYYGGDSGEFGQMWLVPPNTLVSGQSSPNTAEGWIALTNFGFAAGAYATEAKQATWSANDGGRGPGYPQSWLIPPNASIAFTLDTANTAAFVVTIGGFDVLEC